MCLPLTRPPNAAEDYDSQNDGQQVYGELVGISLRASLGDLFEKRRGVGRCTYRLWITFSRWSIHTFANTN